MKPFHWFNRAHDNNNPIIPPEKKASKPKKRPDSEKKTKTGE